MPSYFYLYLSVTFLNAFVDLGHKIVIQNTIFKLYDGSEQIALTAIINLFILLPFIAFFSSSGYISDKYAKKWVMVSLSAIAVLITLGITYCYYHGLFELAFFMTLLLAIQSAFYSPAKYGIIKELVGKNRLVKANAFVQSLTIVAILGSTLLFSFGFESLYKNILVTPNNSQDILISIAPLGWGLVMLSLIEMLFTLLIPSQHQKKYNSTFDIKKAFKLQLLKENLQHTFKYTSITFSIFALSLFFAISQVLLASIGAYLKENADVSSAFIAQAVTASAAIGIILGSITFHFLSQKDIRLNLLPVSAVSVIAVLVLLGTTNNILCITLLLFIFGFMGSWIIIPLNALIQDKADSQLLGTTIAGNNFIQNLLMSLFLLLTVALSYFAISAETIFLLLALISTIGAFVIFKYMPMRFDQLILLFIFSWRYNLTSHNSHHIPKTGAALILGNHITYVDWVFIMLSSERKVRFVIDRKYYEMPILKSICKLYHQIPISESASKDALQQVANALNNGDVVCLFPEGGLSKKGKVEKLKKGYEIILKKTHVPVHIVPFYMQGLWASRLSRAPKKNSLRHFLYRKVTLRFGAPLPKEITSENLYQKILLTKHKLH
jgi:acyl-[acyl-carrier-protein]-phospholipid O-acyltransferase / long-chain-fatty-acid--[acyl-carrier-protein] ligase